MDVRYLNFDRSSVRPKHVQYVGVQRLALENSSGARVDYRAPQNLPHFLVTWKIGNFDWFPATIELFREPSEEPPKSSTFSDYMENRQFWLFSCYYRAIYRAPKIFHIFWLHFWLHKWTEKTLVNKKKFKFVPLEIKRIKPASISDVYFNWWFYTKAKVITCLSYWLFSVAWKTWQSRLLWIAQKWIDHI